MKIDYKTFAVDQKYVAEVFGLTTRRIRQIVADGWFSANEDGKYVLRDAIAGYQAMIVAAASRRSNPSNERLLIAKAEQIEARISKFDREHAATAEVLHFFDEITGVYLESLDRLPALFTTDPRERVRIEAIVAVDRKRLSARWAELRKEVETGIPAKNQIIPDDEEDA